jgi:hypothetical protein
VVVPAAQELLFGILTQSRGDVHWSGEVENEDDDMALFLYRIDVAVGELFFVGLDDVTAAAAAAAVDDGDVDMTAAVLIE